MHGIVVLFPNDLNGLNVLNYWNVSVALPYYLVRPRQHIRWNRQADLLGGFEIDDELEFYWLLYRKISRLGTFEDFVNVGGGTPVEVDGTYSVRYETARVAKLYFRVHRGQFVFRSQSYDLTWVRVVKGIPLYQECVACCWIATSKARSKPVMSRTSKD